MVIRIMAPWTNRSFSVRVSHNVDCSSPVSGVGYQWSGTDYFQTLWTTTLADGIYYWCLYAFDGANSSGWSSSRALNVESAHNVTWLSHNTPANLVTAADYTVTIQVQNTGTISRPASGNNAVHLVIIG